MIIVTALLAFWAFCLADVLMARRFRMGERWMWVLMVLIGSIPGAALYLLLGKKWGDGRRAHPSQGGRRVPRQAGPRGPDDDPDFLRSLG